eukprot:Protomagalhaensia_sp_Gyna_25__4156@NODE_376_length_3661_cov_110_664550_g288_i0_p1_GENE_NODE_376_length_3661_cov_110_664550_g288_i0NODE_376_length_3661_cov_110_664550_g288_i0_p1_ORF_typecomplete_len463_score29_34Granulin/PF00396_18/0_13_NODE_376_length_3661_cov_110_664550_g288_i019943382
MPSRVPLQETLSDSPKITLGILLLHAASQGLEPEASVSDFIGPLRGLSAWPRLNQKLTARITNVLTQLDSGEVSEPAAYQSLRGGTCDAKDSGYSIVTVWPSINSTVQPTESNEDLWKDLEEPNSRTIQSHTEPLLRDWGESKPTSSLFATTECTTTDNSTPEKWPATLRRALEPQSESFMDGIATSRGLPDGRVLAELMLETFHSLKTSEHDGCYLQHIQRRILARRHRVFCRLWQEWEPKLDTQTKQDSSVVNGDFIRILDQVSKTIEGPAIQLSPYLLALEECVELNAKTDQQIKRCLVDFCKPHLETLSEALGLRPVHDARLRPSGAEAWQNLKSSVENLLDLRGDTHRLARLLCLKAIQGTLRAWTKCLIPGGTTCSSANRCCTEKDLADVASGLFEDGRYIFFLNFVAHATQTRIVWDRGSTAPELVCPEEPTWPVARIRQIPGEDRIPIPEASLT